MSSPAPRLARQDHTQWRVLPLVATWSGNIYKDTLPVSEKSKNRKWQYIVHSKPTLASVSPAHGPVCLCWISALAPAARHHGLQQPNEIKSKKARSKASSGFHCDCWGSPGPDQHSCVSPSAFQTWGCQEILNIISDTISLILMFVWIKMLFLISNTRASVSTQPVVCC